MKQTHPPIKFTTKRVEELALPEEGERVVFDTQARGLALRLRTTGGRSWVFVYRIPGAGRDGQPKRITIGSAKRWTVDEARREAARLWTEVADRRDPAAERRAAREKAKEAQERQEVRDARLHLLEALDAYEAYLTHRGVKRRANVLSTLRRHLMGDDSGAEEAFRGLGNVAVEEIDRPGVMALVTRLEASGQRGAAQELRTKASTFLNWAVDRGHIEANPLAGLRRERTTRAQRAAGKGRMLTEQELGAIWRACADPAVNAAFGAIVRTLILTGQRRTETAQLRWQDVDLASGWWIIPAELTKNGHAHEVPITRPLHEIIEARPRHNSRDWIFTNTGASPVSGWSKLEPKLREAAGLSEPWTLHDLRRSFRSGLTRLGTDDRLAELMINHRPQDLQAIYDREPRLVERQEVAARWAAHLKKYF